MWVSIGKVISIYFFLFYRYRKIALSLVHRLHTSLRIFLFILPLVIGKKIMENLLSRSRKFISKITSTSSFFISVKKLNYLELIFFIFLFILFCFSGFLNSLFLCLLSLRKLWKICYPFSFCFSCFIWWSIFSFMFQRINIKK